MTDYFKKLPENSIIDWCNDNWEDDSITAPVMDDKTALDFLADYLLPDEFYVSYSCSRGQANTEIVCYLIEEYAKRFKNEYRHRKKIKKLEDKIDKIIKNLKKD